MSDTRTVEGNSSAPAAPINFLPGPSVWQREGLTKREYMATMALQGILAHSYNDATYEGAACDAVAHADELLRALADEEEVRRG